MYSGVKFCMKYGVDEVLIKEKVSDKAAVGTPVCLTFLQTILSIILVQEVYMHQ
jgi:hypothetical protein